MLEIFLFVVLPLALMELIDLAPFLADRLAQHVAAALPKTHRERFRDEWIQQLGEVPGKLSKLAYAISLAVKLPWILSDLYEVPVVMGGLYRLTTVRVLEWGFELLACKVDELEFRVAADQRHNHRPRYPWRLIWQYVKLFLRVPRMFVPILLISSWNRVQPVKYGDELTYMLVEVARDYVERRFDSGKLRIHPDILSKAWARGKAEITDPIAMGYPLEPGPKKALEDMVMLFMALLKIERERKSKPLKLDKPND